MLTDGAIAKDEFAELLGAIPSQRMNQLRRMAAHAPWRQIPARRYDTADVEFWEPCTRAFFIRIPPNGFIPRHHDVFISGPTHHLVVQTNPQSSNGWIDTVGTERSVHMEFGHRYKVAREPLHWATNNGDTDRIHLLVEFP